MTIAQQNKKRYRPSMLVCCGIDTVPDTMTVTPTTRYGSGTYDTNMRAGRRGISVKLMDLAGGGFALDGTHHPISSTRAADDGDETIQLLSYKGYVRYGIPAPTASNSAGLTSDIGFSIPDVPEGTSKLTAHLRDSEGKTYRVTASSVAALVTAIKAVAITPGARLYVDRVAAGDSWQWDKSNLIGCGLALRGVDTNGNDPDLQMSEIEIRGIVPTSDIESIANMAENSPIWYAAGYFDDVTPVRRFYLSEGITTENIVATIKGYDATKFLESEHYGVISTYDRGKFSRGEYMRRFARRCYGILSRGLVYNHDVEYARSAVNRIKGKATTDSDIRYMSTNGVPRRSMVAAYVNLLRSPSGGLDNSAMYLDYVDAGLPTWRAGTVPIGRSDYGHKWNLKLSDVSDFEEEAEVAISKISAEVSRPTWETDEQGNTKYTSWYAEMVSQGDSRYIDTEEPYSAHKFKGYDRDERENNRGNRKWIHSKIGNLYRVLGHYYPDIEDFGFSAFKYRIESLKSTKQRLVGVRNVMTSPKSLSSQPSGVTYEDGKITYTTGKRGEKIEFPDCFHGILVQASSVSGSTAVGSKSLWGLLLKQIGDRSNIVYKFKYRGNPKMQPRDIIAMDMGGGVTVNMTIDNLTLEHEAGGLISEIECRKGII